MSSWFDRNRHRYPENWDEIATAVKETAGWRCRACGEQHGPSPFVLTVDHFDHDPANCAPENLIALCQRCHLRRQGLSPAPASVEEALRRLSERARQERMQIELPLALEVAS